MQTDKEYLRHKRAFSFFHKILKHFFCRKLNYQYDDLSKIEGPYLLLANHNIEMDPILVGIAAKNQLYFVASEHIMRKGFGTWFLMRYFRPIIHMKGKAGLKSSMEILRTIKNGHSVALFPEGNRSFNGLTREIPDVTGKLARSCRAKVVTFRMEGGYFTQPRWSTTLRRGKIYGHLVNVYEADAIRKMTEEEINECIRKDLFEDAYETQGKNPVAFQGKHLALGMESTLFWCPKCKKIGTLVSDDQSISCSCGYRATFDSYGQLHGADGQMQTITQWDRQQYEYLKMQLKDGAQLCFEDDVTLQKINGHDFVESKQGRLVVTPQEIQFGEYRIKRDNIQGAAVFSRNVLSVHLGDDDIHYEIRGDISFNALKYLYLFELSKE